MARLACDVLLERKGEGIVVLKMDEVLPIVDYFVIVNGRNARHVGSLGEAVEKHLKDWKVPRLHRTGREAKSWILLDYGAVVVHIFQEEFREFYDLELLWTDAETIPLEDLAPEMGPIDDPDSGARDPHEA